MPPQTERESKFELDQRAFERLVGAGRIARRDEQLNVYYDHRWRLASRAVTFRVRFVQGAPPTLTLKVPTSRDGAMRTSDEYEYPLDRATRGRWMARPVIDVASELVPPIAAVLRAMGLHQLHRMGWVRNERLVVDVPAVGRVELDRLQLPGNRTVFEAELEHADDAAHARFAAWVQAHAPGARPSSASKFERFRLALVATLQSVLLEQGINGDVLAQEPDGFSTSAARGR